MTDLFVPRLGTDYAEVFAGDLPTGPAWPRDLDSTLMQFVAGLCELWGDVDQRFADFLVREADPRTTLELLPDWERAYGLPDPCVAEPLTIEDRRKALLNKITIEGAQSRQFFIGVAAALGYVITIQEYSPFMCGVSRCGDTRSVAPASVADIGFRWEVGPPEIRYYWKVRVFGRRLTWFRMGSSQCGVDPMLRIALATDLECVLRRWKPAHTEVIFDYSNATQDYAEYIWFRCGISHVGVDHMFTSIPHSEAVFE